jgi:CubicO group peptidase (beta-lactamase class C family)
MFMNPTAEFADLHRAMQAQVDQQFLPGVSTALMRGREVVDTFVCGMADREAGVALREDHIFRIFSSTKLVTSCAVMMLVESGRIGLDDPIENHLPELGSLRVLRPGAVDARDTEPQRSSITVRHLMTHTSGLSYGLFDPGTPLFTAYQASGVRNPSMSLADMVSTLAKLPLSFQPGTQWEYSMATDVLGRLVEVVCGRPLGKVLSERIFGPLGMVDTAFWVPESKRDRLCALYEGVDLMDPTKPGLVRVDHKPYPGAYVGTAARESGGGGLVSTLGDSVRLLRSLMPGGATLLQPATIALMFGNQLAKGLCVQFPNMPRFENRGFGLGSAATIGPIPGEPEATLGEAGWGGLAGTIWWINPRLDIAAVLMTQRYFGFGNAYALSFKQEAYRALGH